MSLRDKYEALYWREQSTALCVESMRRQGVLPSCLPRQTILGRLKALLHHEPMNIQDDLYEDDRPMRVLSGVRPLVHQPPGKRCVKCGAPFDATREQAERVQYFKTPEGLERLRMTCWRCGYHWEQSTVDAPHPSRPPLPCTIPNTKTP